MPTQTKENYLKAIYLLQLKQEEVTVTSIGENLQVSKPTVHNMIKKLSEKGWIEYQAYKPIRLTTKGKKVAALIIRKHRLAEMFLVQMLGFGWEEVHQIAEEMEHLKSDALFDRIDEILGYPPTDPHGSPIPNKNGEYQPATYKPLSAYSAGDSLTLQAIGDSSSALLELLNERQISLGTTFTIRKVEAFDKTFYLDYGDQTNVSLSYEVCKRLLVKVKD